MKLASLFVLIFFATVPLPCRAIVNRDIARDIACEGLRPETLRPQVSDLPNLPFLQVKDLRPERFGSQTLTSGATKTAAHFFKKMLFKPKKKRKNGIDWTREPTNGLKSVVLAALGWGIILMAFQIPAVAVLAWLLATILLGIAFGIGLRGLKKKKKADRMPSYIGILLGSPGALALVLIAISMVLSLLFTIFSIPIFFLLLLFGL